MQDHLNTYMEETGIPQELRIRLRNYLIHCRQMMRHKFYNSVLRYLSPGLAAEFAIYVHTGWVDQVPFFKCDDEEEMGKFITALAVHISVAAYPPRETIVAIGQTTDRMFIIQRGNYIINII